jgi:general stress protein 26
MELKASEIQKQRIQEIEAEADALVRGCDIMFVSSVNEKGYPRTCCVSKLKDEGFRDVYFVTSKRSEKQGKAKHFEINTKSSVCFQRGADALTLVGEVEMITDKAVMQELWRESDRAFFSKGLDDPKIRFVRFHTLEATFWIGRKFRTVRYK